MGAEWVGLLKAEQFTNLQQLRAKATVFFTVHTEVGLAWSDSSLGCEIELCVPELLGTLFFPLEWSGFHQLFRRWDGPKKTVIFQLTGRPPQKLWVKRCVCVLLCLVKVGMKKSRRKARAYPTWMRRNLCFVFTVCGPVLWPALLVERETLLITACEKPGIVKKYFKRIYYFILIACYLQLTSNVL